MATRTWERKVAHVANTVPAYMRNVVAPPRIDHINKPFAGWRDRLVSYYRLWEGTYGNVWKPASSEKFVDLTLQVYSDFREAYRIHLKNPIEHCESDYNDIPVTVLIAQGFIAEGFDRKNIVRNGCRAVYLLDEAKPEDRILAQMSRSLAARGDQIRHMGYLDAEPIRSIASGKVALVAKSGQLLQDAVGESMNF